VSALRRGSRKYMVNLRFETTATRVHISRWPMLEHFLLTSSRRDYDPLSLGNTYGEAFCL